MSRLFQARHYNRVAAYVRDTARFNQEAARIFYLQTAEMFAADAKEPGGGPFDRDRYRIACGYDETKNG